MIENHYELNMAYAGQHFCRVVFPGPLTEDGAKLRAKMISTAMEEHDGGAGRWHFILSKVNCYGTNVEF